MIQRRRGPGSSRWVTYFATGTGLLVGTLSLLAWYSKQDEDSACRCSRHTAAGECCSIIQASAAIMASVVELTFDVVCRGLSAPLSPGTGPVQAATINLPSFPLAVKSPYLSTWVSGSDVLDDASTAQPQFWSGAALTWPVVARVSGTPYALFGDASNATGFARATTESVSYTSTHTLIRLRAGTAEFLLDFFTPVLPGPDQYLEQSLPYSYLTVSVSSGRRWPVHVQVLAGIDQTWTAQEGAAQLDFDSSTEAGFFYFHNPDAIPFTESADMATYGSVIFGADMQSRASHACAAASSVFAEFAEVGSLTPGHSCAPTDLAAIAKDISAPASSATFIVGFDRVQAVNYLGHTQTGYYRSRWPTIHSAVQHVLQSYRELNANSMVFDSLVRARAESVSDVFGSQYADMVEAGVRQTFATMELTIPISDLSAAPSAFIKEISSDGNMNTVDLLFQTSPVFFALAPDYLRLLTQPILSYLESGAWPLPWVIHDIGSAYPNATGHDDGQAEQMPLFETSSLFILLHAHQRLTGDTSYVDQYKPLLEGYAQWLAGNNSLYPNSQLISVDAIAAKPNQTGLAMQSAMGLNAAGILLGNREYGSLAASYVHALWTEGLGLDGSSPATSSHFTYYYGQNSTWNVLFPSFFDAVLDLHTFPPEAWAMQSRWYAAHIAEEGLPFANGLDWGLLDWNMVVAAVSSPHVREAIVSTSHAFLTNGQNSVPFGTRYYVEGPEVGDWVANKARPIGGVFALLPIDTDFS
ncbi:hypothetical protein GGR56DRAFT_628769 [Xylariaceae sp. FL0804]|nr:hypothetical protein GGR56DRAFT_628769 [Xylariaceae sp. FL0804]